ncbi:glycosyltransferase [Sphingomonas azotifigens]|uniref:glycosyltransferase n=1 Tax=Sphingomonas azotifigens TaxID=330920 RepID=UPI00111C6279|nr:glycosyltransferase [Sphingomonas azotifigens]
MAFAETLQGGGVERALLRMAAGWLERGHRVTLVLGACEGPLAAELPPGIELIELGSPHYPILLRMPGKVRSVDPDILFCPGNYYTAVSAVIRLRLGRACPPIVAKVSNALVRPEMWRFVAWGYNRWLRWHPWFLDHIVAMTPAMAREAITEMAIPQERVSVIANPPAERIHDAAPIALPAGRYIVGVGRLEPQKRWDRLIDALPRLADRSVQLLLLGEGSARASLAAQVARMGLGDRVRMPGHVSDPLPALKGATVAALTSDFEGVPGVIREALSQGTPVVATEASVAVRELIDSPALGSVVAREDGDALVAALEHWLAPGRARPVPRDDAGDPVGDYLALFSRLARQRIA